MGIVHDLDKIATKLELIGNSSLAQKLDCISKDLRAIRSGVFEYCKRLFPKMPDYVIRDWVYWSVARGHLDSKYFKWIVDTFKDKSWSFKTIKITLDSFDRDTRDELNQRLRNESIEYSDNDKKDMKNRKRFCRNQKMLLSKSLLFF